MVDGFSGGITRYQIGCPGTALLEPGIVAADGLAQSPVGMAAVLLLPFPTGYDDDRGRAEQGF